MPPKAHRVRTKRVHHGPGAGVRTRKIGGMRIAFPHVTLWPKVKRRKR